MWIICIIFFLFLHSFMNMKIEDDNTFQNTLHDMGLLPYMFKGYFTWSSRVLINGVDIIFMAAPMWVWQIMDVAMVLLLFYELQQICYDRFQNPTPFVLLGLLCSFQLTHMSNAGWIATTINYLWALAIGLYCINALFGINRGKPYKWYQYMLFVAAFLFGCSSELMAAIIFSSFVAAHFVYLTKKIKFPKWYIIGGEVTSAIILIIHLISPGEHKRAIREMEKFIPEYEFLSVLDKIRLNYIATFAHFISKPNVLFFLFCLILIIGVVIKQKSIAKRLVSCIPMAICGIGTLYYFIMQQKGLKKDGYDDPLLYCTNSYERIEQISMIIIFTILIITIALTLYWIVEDKFLYGELMLVFAQGFATRMVVSFSPTMYASSTRIYIYLYFSFIFVIATLIELLKDHFGRKLWGLLILIFVAGAGVNYVTLLHLSQAITRIYS